MAQIITAIDTATLAEAKGLIADLKGKTLFKLGLEFAEKFGPQGILELNLTGEDLFIDHKWADIPNTVEGAIRSTLEHIKPRLVTVYALSGRETLKRAADYVHTHSPATQVIAVTVLTSMSEIELSSLLGQTITPQDFTLHLTSLAYQAGCDGVVCSGQEIKAMRAAFGEDLTLVVPGIRPENYATNDNQSRIVTPHQAQQDGADYLVIGRPITQAPNPADALAEVLTSLS